MTSVPNHPQRLSGNNFVAYKNISLFLLASLFFMLSSCDALKKVPREDKSKENEELEEIKGSRVYNPASGKWEEPSAPASTMDTIAWTEPSIDVAPPMTSDGSGDGSGDGIGVKKDEYNVAILLPFMTNNFEDLDGRINQKSELAINFYGGMQMAFSELSEVSVHDTQASESVVSELLENEKVACADLIIGPISKNNLKLVAEYTKAKKKPMVSPLSPSTSIAKDNPYYLQVSPGLEEHCKTISRHALDKYKPEQLVLVCRNKKAETNRLQYFQTANQEHAGKSNVDPLKEFIVTDASIDFSEMDITPYILSGKTTVFIVPSWSNESFIYSLMRNVSIAKGKNKVVFYGMPQWMNFEQISYDYFENLNLHVSSDTDINSDSDEVKRFKQNFYYKFGSLPEEEAYVGYDVMRYFGRELFEGGTQFQKTIDQNGKDMLHTRFALSPVAPNDAKPEDYSKIERYENSYVNILQFKHFHFQLAD
jgi:ABC-type branched-subunit amino acid transport system substrate-binding protein